MLISMWVAPEARRTGVGAALVDAVIDWARAQGFPRLGLEVVDGNAAARALYARKGFEPVGESLPCPPPREHLREQPCMLELGARATASGARSEPQASEERVAPGRPGAGCRRTYVAARG